MTKNIRLWLLASLAVAAIGATGCILTSAQIMTHFDLPNPITINPGNLWERVPVDLAADVGSEYTDNKDKLKGLTDIAVLGKFKNNGGAGGTVTVWITANPTTYSDVGTIEANATKLWTSPAMGATGSELDIEWDDSAALFDATGKQMLIAETLGDGIFTLYTTGSGGTTDIEVLNGMVILVLDAGQ